MRAAGTRRVTADNAILPAGSRVAIIAGSGALPLDIAEQLNARGHMPFVLRIAGEADRDFSAFDGDDIELEAARDLLPMLRRAGATHLVLAGGISRRPDIKAVRFGFALIPLAMRAAAALLRGDNGLLGALVGFFEARGFKVVGAHQILPELLAPEACLTKRRPSAAEWTSIRAGMEAARVIGAIDAGQAVVVIGERAVALEGVEGTAAMIARVRDLKASGRISARSAGVLVKRPKPGQEVRVDLPSIGPDTISAARDAGLAGVAVEAGGSLLLEAAETVVRADAAGIFLVGVAP